MQGVASKTGQDGLLPDVCVAVLPQTLVIEAIDLEAEVLNSSSVLVHIYYI